MNTQMVGEKNSSKMDLMQTLHHPLHAGFNLIPVMRGKVLHELRYAKVLSDLYTNLYLMSVQLLNISNFILSVFVVVGGCKVPEKVYP